MKKAPDDTSSSKSAIMRAHAERLGIPINDTPKLSPRSTVADLSGFPTYEGPFVTIAQNKFVLTDLDLDELEHKAVVRLWNYVERLAYNAHVANVMHAAKIAADHGLPTPIRRVRAIST